VPPSAFIAGVIALAELDAGIWKAPANIGLAGVAAAVVAINKVDAERLNADNINPIRVLPGRGLRVWGARTLSRDPAQRYIPLRRLARMIAISVDTGLGWTVFEPEGPLLWARVTASVENCLSLLWRQGAFPGRTPREAFFVRCGLATMTADDIAAGRLIVEIGFAALKPAEFEVLRIVRAVA
jgi:phage tail sheath protein FI